MSDLKLDKIHPELRQSLKDWAERLDKCSMREDKPSTNPYEDVQKQEAEAQAQKRCILRQSRTR